MKFIRQGMYDGMKVFYREHVLAYPHHKWWSHVLYFSRYAAFVILMNSLDIDLLADRYDLLQPFVLVTVYVEQLSMHGYICVYCLDLVCLKENYVY